MTMKYPSMILATASLALVVLGIGTVASHSSSQPPATLAGKVSGADLSQWSTSEERLVDQLIAALASNDPQLLHSLRVNREEYVSVIVPWTVPSGQPPRQVRDKVAEFYWQLIDSRSRDFGRMALKEFGGQKLKRVSYSFSEAPVEYAGYRAKGELRVEVENERGAPATVHSGWVAEIGGRYKLLGFEWDD